MTANDNQSSKIDNSDDTGLPILRRWPALYAVVLAWFVVVVIALTLFTRYYTQ